MGTYGELSNILSTVYGVGVLVASSTTILWAAERLADDLGIAAAKQQLSALNRRRNRMGKTIAVPAFGHRLF